MKLDMDLKDYREQPDNGLFEKIERRLRHRRLMRRAGATAAVAVVAAVAAVVLWPNAADSESVASRQVTMQQLPVGTSWSADVQPAKSTASNVNAETVRPTTSDAPEVVKSNQKSRKDSIIVMPFKEDSPLDVVDAISPVSVQPKSAPVVTAETMGRQLPSGINNMNLESHRQLANESQKSHLQKVVEVIDSVIYPMSTPVKNDPAEEPLPHEDNLFWAPNVIVPAGDVDDNRTFSMKFTSTVSQFMITIFNRGGRQVFQSNDPAFVWDGTFKGSALSQGAYIWVAKFRDSAGKLHEEHGTVTLIR
jgi:gliding motility-associated-like protein